MPPPKLISTTNKIINLARSGQISNAQTLFDETPQKDVICYNAMLTAYSTSDLPHKALSLFSSMHNNNSINPDHFSLTSAFKAASRITDIHIGTQLHSLTLRLGFISLPTQNAIINMYAKCMSPYDAVSVFDTMVERNVVSWCSLLDAYMNSGMVFEAMEAFDKTPAKNTIAWNVMILGFGSSKAIELFITMRDSGFKGDDLTYSGVMNACTDIHDPHIGYMMHCTAYRNGWSRAVEVGNSILTFYAAFGMKDQAMLVFGEIATKSQVSWNAIIDACMKVGDIDSATSFFERAPAKNVISWTSMISGFSRSGDTENALSTFSTMLRNSCKPDEFSLGIVLQACAIMATLKLGEMTHCCAMKLGFEPSMYVANSVLNMYAKCGDIDASGKVFNAMKQKNTVSWNSMILGFALHGRASKAFKTYTKMVESRGVPDKVTVLGLLVACRHTGLVGEAERVIDGLDGGWMEMEHLGCVVDMVGREGERGEGWKVVSGSEGIGVSFEVGEAMVRRKPESEEGYVMLSNLYCVNGRWMEAERVRKEMVEKGVKKVAGCSWVEVGGVMQVFVCGSKEVGGLMMGVYEMVSDLHTQMRNNQCLICCSL